MSKEKSAPAAAPAANPQANQKLHLKYESMTAVFADHVVLNSTNGGVILDFASSIVSDPGSGDSTLPVHTRVAMTHHGAAQLLRMLSGLFTQAQQGAQQGEQQPS
ncbi:MAG: hypothetical protein KDM63_05630 [Verrucomicrobiae bacterium]|nr:hypothetical protein [Verrucomicrobiae bacterium]MCB1086504.1 hypothetical protein [Verrucomicrobiae bacterium]MCB1091716.1 hypothetical protein [Verrucomicrobiae bacterium]